MGIFGMETLVKERLQEGTNANGFGEGEVTIVAGS